MRILFVASTGDVQTARWIKQLKDTNWDIHVFDPLHGLLHPALTDVTIHTAWRKKETPQRTTVHCRWPLTRGRHFVEQKFPKIWRWIVPKSEIMLAKLIRELRPDCIHSLGMQAYSYDLLEATNMLGGRLDSPWIYSCKGSDIYYWSRFVEHEIRIRHTLKKCKFLICNCERDVRLARQYGFKGQFLGFFQGSGGYPITFMQSLRQKGPVSKRRVIAVKGLQHACGRALVALESIKKCVDVLNGYKIEIHQAHSETSREAKK